MAPMPTMPTTPEQEKTRVAAARKAFIAEGFDLVADTYDEVNGEFFRATAARLVQHAGLRPGDRVLDLGCGRGAVLFAAAQAVGPDGYAAGLDLSPGMVQATGAEIASRALRNVVVRVGDAEDPGYPAASFEAVLAGLMLFITPDPEAALSAAHHILTPGGRFATSSFGTTDPRWSRPLDAALSFLDEPLPPSSPRQGARGGHPAFDSVESIGKLFESCGFTEVRTVTETTSEVLASGDAWWRSLWSTGRRAWLSRIPADRLPAAKAAALAELEALREGGELRRESELRYTVATRA
ncbi:ubiquinone/menaquinone biosynthesis C-methylase UbiE [Streptacidiphilus sp. BW17]